MNYETIRISKLEAARRQLRTAITLWFTGGDSVAIHSLAFAAYEILHAISEKRDPNRMDLIFDSAWIKDEHRRDWNQVIRKDANFFKHADRDGDSVIEFKPQTSEIFMLFAIYARELCGETSSEEERIFSWWLRINRPALSTEKGRVSLTKQLKVDEIKHLRTLSKHEFFDFFRELAALARGVGR
jgi:hypothetical protein